MQPFYADSTFVVTGFTHPAYREKTIKLLKQLPYCTDFLFVRGIEGSAAAPIDRRCPIIYTTVNQQHLHEEFCSPEDYSIKKNTSIEANTSLSLNESLDFIMEGIRQ